jgi:hypothetical protein
MNDAIRQAVIHSHEAESALYVAARAFCAEYERVYFDSQPQVSPDNPELTMLEIAHEELGTAYSRDADATRNVVRLKAL